MELEPSPHTRNSVIYQDLLKHTPVDHPDYPLLQDALRISQNFLSSINEDIDPRRTAVTTPKGEVSWDPWHQSCYLLLQAVQPLSDPRPS